jgi:ketosteroid isomerase-like protein
MAEDPRLRALLDVEEIRQLKNLYGHLYDGGDVAAAMELFTDDAVCEFSPRYGDWIGKAEIAEKYAGIWAASRAAGGQPFQILHAFANPWIVLTGPDTATGRWYLLEFTTREGEANPPRLFARYRDAYRREQGRWKIARMSVDFLWPARSVKGEG